MKTNSSVKDLGICDRGREWAQFFLMRLRGLAGRDDFGWLWENIDEYERSLFHFTGKHLKTATVLEVGYGARPYRLLALLSMGVAARGVDLDAPILRGRLEEFSLVYENNGFERCLKSFIRFFCFDWKQRSDLRRAFRGRGFELMIPERVGQELIVEDASSAVMNERIAPNSLDLVFSEDVFEHIPSATLPLLVANLARWIKPDGVALIRPNIFTGITGGHLVEWYAHKVGESTPRKSEPWEHLRKKRHRANTFLNELGLSEYRMLFSEHFEILEEKITHPDLGRQYLTEEIRRDLRSFADQELFSNQILFTMRPKC